MYMYYNIYVCVYRIAGNFSQVSDKHNRKKFRDFYFKVAMSDYTLYNFPHGMVTHNFNVKKDSKISTLIKACWSLSAKNCHAKGRELTP